MTRSDKLYFEWLLKKVCTTSEIKEYSLLLMHLFDTTFVSYDEFDDNLVENSIGLRGIFLEESRAGYKFYEIYGGFEYDCTVLELLVYISMKIEDQIMTNDLFGDRYSEWFWQMLDSLGLKNTKNTSYNEQKVVQIMENFIEKRYKKSGKGGLFTTKNQKIDMRTMDIWSQCMSFLTNFVKSDGELW